MKHDPAAIMARLEPVFKLIKAIKPNLRAINLVSDSPSSQYRNQQMFFYFGHYIVKYFPQLEVSTWNYLEAGQGKGMADGVGGTIKRTADRIICHGKDIDCLEMLVTELKDKVRSITTTVIDAKEIEQFKANINLNHVKPGCNESSPNSSYSSTRTPSSSFTYEEYELL